MPSTLKTSECSFEGLNCVLVKLPSIGKGPASRLNDLVDDLEVFFNEVNKGKKLSIHRKPSITDRDGISAYHYTIMEEQGHGKREQVIKSGIVITAKKPEAGLEGYVLCFDSREANYHTVRYKYLNYIKNPAKK